MATAAPTAPVSLAAPAPAAPATTWAAGGLETQRVSSPGSFSFYFLHRTAVSRTHHQYQQHQRWEQQEGLKTRAPVLMFLALVTYRVLTTVSVLYMSY